MLCKLTPEEEVRMHILLKGIADDPNALEMQKFIQHGSVTTYEHCLRVTRIAFWLNIHLHARADEASLIKGAFLHDFYLYDWHNCSNITHWHGFKHARIARYNAETVFKLTDQGKGHHPEPHVAAEPHRHAPQPRGRACLHGRQDVVEL